PPQLVAYMQPHVSQHELFIRAALEGRRDHVYQAAMFDPLTAATMTLDKIVEMCDELIAAHGDLLPKLDGKKTLVATSGKSFGAVDTKILRKSWDDTHARSVADYIIDWHVIGPFKDKSPETISLELATSVEQQLAKGPIDLNAFYSDGNGAML